MESAIKICAIGCCFLLLTSLSISISKATPKEKEEIESVCSELEKAIDLRKFSDAKELAGALMPLMKRDIKESKKYIVSLQKNKTSEKELETQLISFKRKTELYQSAKHLIESSPAAIRVKGKQLVKMLNEYIELGIETKN